MIDRLRHDDEENGVGGVYQPDEEEAEGDDEMVDEDDSGSDDEMADGGKVGQKRGGGKKGVSGKKGRNDKDGNDRARRAQRVSPFLYDPGTAAERAIKRRPRRVLPRT